MMKFNLKEFREKLNVEPPPGAPAKPAPGFSDVAVVKIGVKKMAFRDRVVFARKAVQSSGAIFSQADAGEKIVLDVATKLKEIVFGSANIPPPVEWLKQGLVLHPPEHIFAYGMKMPNNEVKNFLMCLQAYFLKNLLFGKKIRTTSVKIKDDQRRKMRAAASKMSLADEVNRVTKKGPTKMIQVLKPAEKAQLEMIVASLTEILLRLSEGNPATFCLPGSDNCFEPTASFAIDGTTEKLRLFPLKNDTEARTVISKYLPYLMEEKGVGVLCIIYSMVLSRGFPKLKLDMQDKADSPLIETAGECSLCLFNMVIFGMATPYLHNGTLNIEDENGEIHERVGIAGRSEIGFLVWEGSEGRTAGFNLGSRLKTPTMPIWISRCNGKLGVLFNPNKELMKSYHAENRFQLYYYADHEFKKGIDKQETILTIDTRNKTGSTINPDLDMEEMCEPPLQSAIKTKWPGADVIWNNEVIPYVW